MLCLWSGGAMRCLRAWGQCPVRALLRLKPSRMCANSGYYVRYTMPHNAPQRPGGRCCWVCTAQAKAFAQVC
jgi:hypothetical protein